MDRRIATLEQLRPISVASEQKVNSIARVEVIQPNATVPKPSGTLKPSIMETPAIDTNIVTMPPPVPVGSLLQPTTNVTETPAIDTNTTKTTAKAKTAHDSQKTVDSPIDYKAKQAHTTNQDDSRTTAERQPNDTYNKGKNDKKGENVSKSSSSSMDLSFAHFSLDAKRLFDLLSPSERSEFRDDVCEFACAAHRMGEGSKLVGEWIKNAKRQAKAGQMFDYLKGCVRHSANDRGLRWTDLTKDCPPSPSDWPGVATVSLKIDRERMRIGIYKSNPAKWSQASDAEMEQEINRMIEAAS